MSKKSSGIIAYDVCYPKGSLKGEVISTFHLCAKHGKEFMKKWIENDYTVNQKLSNNRACDICPDKETI